jgi:CheY-like chemotaxis protein
MNPAGAGIVILVVEDQRENRILIAQLLRDFGHTVFECENATEALQTLDRLGPSRPCLMLLDLQLPGMSGAELLEAVGHRPGNEQVRVVVLSATEVPRSVMADGRVVDIVRKPGGAHAVLRAIERARAH